MSQALYDIYRPLPAKPDVSDTDSAFRLKSLIEAECIQVKIASDAESCAILHSALRSV